MENLRARPVRIRAPGRRKWILLELLLAIICIVGFAVLAVLIIKHIRRIRTDMEPISNDTMNQTKNATYATEYVNYTLSNRTQLDQSENATYAIEYVNYTLSNSIQLDQSIGRPLGNAFYSNQNLLIKIYGYVRYVYVRLFTPWQGHAPLYIYIIQITFPSTIKYRYPVEPQRGTTEWQLIDISANMIPINCYESVGVGMEDSSDTNQIYGLNKTYGFGTRKGVKNITEIFLMPEYTTSVAIGFTVARNGTYKFFSVNISSAPVVLPASPNYQIKEYINFSLPDSVVYESTYGYPLGNAVYVNLGHFNGANGSVVYLNLRLFTPWQGKAPLYIFAILINKMDIKSIVQRYPVEPQRNTTDWQTIQIPLYALQIRTNTCLGIGMQNPSDRNKLYVINTLGTLFSKNITQHATNLELKADMRTGVAFSFTVAQYY
ncbi:unnamed protein product [Adineta ricciae]|uniref:Uncharacterized protein n=1 Tax=Adineta ricciae TaxID=249248 RepID=A0A814GP57_ADIRI|nr:unnamed protein product [Adineta ricciae]